MHSTHNKRQVVLDTFDCSVNLHTTSTPKAYVTLHYVKQLALQLIYTPNYQGIKLIMGFDVLTL